MRDAFDETCEKLSALIPPFWQELILLTGGFLSVFIIPSISIASVIAPCPEKGHLKFPTLAALCQLDEYIIMHTP